MQPRSHLRNPNLTPVAAPARRSEPNGITTMRTLALSTVLPALAALAPAQTTQILTSVNGTTDARTLALDPAEIDEIREGDIYEVFPLPGVPYSLRPFLPISLQWHFAGDIDGDGQYVEGSDSGPTGSGNGIDAIFRKATAPGPFTPRDIYFSTESASSTLGTLPSDVVRYAGQGVLEYFLTEAQLETATGGTTLNLDALCQTLTGDLFFSFSLTETLHFGSADDGDLLFIPSSAITYDASGNVVAIAANSATIVLEDSDLNAMQANSGFVEFDGGPPSTLFDLSGLDLDPNGGTFVSPVDTLVYPNLVWTWSDSSNDGAILSTALGGSFAVINGVPMGSAVATTGAQIGLQPTSSGTSGLGGLAVIPVQGQQFEVLNYPRNLHTSGDGQTFVQLQVSGGTPNGFTLLAWSVEANTPNGAFPAIPAIPPFTGEFGMLSPVIIGVFANDAQGITTTPLITLDTTVLSGVNLAAQGLDVGTFALSWPSGLSFL